MKSFLWGALTVETAVAAVFFLRYWHVSGDRFFGYFAFAFAFMALNWFAVSTIDPKLEVTHDAYFLRLVAFILIIVGILDKNRRNSRS
ncbi:MAG TPA: DUF5985 family protein [Steroidobacteraceae bacterium]|jgi:hypothetical protein|nr:DUF5985 family protein [Steroidobacteraceae bacterium]